MGQSALRQFVGSSGQIWWSIHSSCFISPEKKKPKYLCYSKFLKMLSYYFVLLPASQHCSHIWMCKYKHTTVSFYLYGLCERETGGFYGRTRERRKKTPIHAKTYCGVRNYPKARWIDGKTCKWTIKFGIKYSQRKWLRFAVMGYVCQKDHSNESKHAL